MLIFISAITQAAESIHREVIYFDIPQQQANVSLTQFANQANLTLIFRYESTQGKTANQLVGHYPVDEAIDVLLAGTGLQPVFSDQGLLLSVADKELETEENRMNVTQKTGLLAFIGAIFAVPVSNAQNTGNVVLEEILVTASKRSEGVQDVPISITALSQQDMTRSGVYSLSELAYMVPGLAVANQGNGRTQLNIRGINSGEVRRDNIRASETVGIYFDEIPVSAVLYNPDLEPFDLARVEVLRGPQGTLYGSGSLAGTIRLISNEPVIDEFEGTIDARYSSITHGDTGYSLKGVINVPLAEDKLAARIAAYTTDDGGWIDNLAPGPGGGTDVNSQERDGIRISALWTPTPELNAKLTYIHQDTFAGGTPNDNLEAVGVQRLVTVGALQPDQTFDSSGEYEQWKYVDQFYDDSTDIFNLQLNYDLGNSELTSSTSFIDRDIRVFVDISSNNLGGGFFPGAQRLPVLGIGLDDMKKVENFSQELRLTSTGDSKLQWIAGAYYSKLDVAYDQALPVTDPAAFSLNIFERFGEQTGVLLRTVADSEVEQYAVFGELKYEFAERFSATVGLRYFDTSQNFDLRGTGILNGGITTPPVRAPQEDGLNPKFLLSYRATDDILLSVQAARGFRLGGAQSNVRLVAVDPTNDCIADLAALGATFDPEGFDSESLWNYELGMKSTWAEQRVQLNASVFFIDYQDLQITTRLTCGSSFTTNAGGAESKGFEFEFKALATDNLELSFGGSYIDASFTEDLISKEAVEGDRLIFVPEWTVNATAAYSKPISNELQAYFNLSFQYTSEVESYFGNNPSKPRNIDSRLDAYQTVNLRAGIETDQWEFALFANNLFDEYALTRLDSINPNGPGGWVTGATIRPRTIGVNVVYNFE